jgi:DNA-binding NarL/FixJ family response regulator
MRDIFRLFIVDDHQMFIDGLKALLRNSKDFEVVGDALEGQTAFNFINCNRVDIVITDVSMPGMSGIELTQLLKEKCPDVKVLIISMYSDRSIIEEVLLAGADGFILKNTGKKEFIDALTCIANHGSYYSSEVIARHVANVVVQRKSEIETRNLSERELEVLKLIVLELSSESIADKLFISKRTVDSHRKNIMEKTGSKSLVGLIKFAIRNNLAD